MHDSPDSTNTRTARTTATVATLPPRSNPATQWLRASE